MAKTSQPRGMQNHLTELLDERPVRSYSERHLATRPDARPRFAGGAPGAPGIGKEAGGPQIRFLRPAESGAPLEKAPEPQPGPFLARLRLRSAASQARRAARIAASSASSSRPTRRPTMPRMPPASMIHASASGVTLGRDRSLLLAPPDKVCDEVVHLAHVDAEAPLQLGILGCLAQRLHPQLRELELRRPDGDVSLADRLDRRARVGRRLRASAPRTRASWPRRARAQRDRGRASRRSGGRGSARKCRRSGRSRRSSCRDSSPR